MPPGQCQTNQAQRPKQQRFELSDEFPVDTSERPHGADRKRP